MASTFRIVTGHVDRNAQVYAAFGLVTYALAKTYPQTLGISSWQSLYANHTPDGKPEAISTATEELTDKVLFDILLKPHFETKISFFAAYGHDMVHYGSCQMKTGGIIGVPSTFNFTTLTDVAKQAFQLNRCPVDWSSSGGQLLMASLLLSEKAKKFAIAREINYVYTNPVWMDLGLVTLFGGGGYMAGFALNRYFNFNIRLKTWARGGVYGVIGATAYALYTTVSDTYSCYRDKKVDRLAGLLSQEYAEGGVEYYEQKLQRNKAIYLLLGSSGSNYYTPYGNEAATFRRPHAQVTERRDNMIKLVRDIEKNPKLLERSTTHYGRINEMDQWVSKGQQKMMGRTSNDLINELSNSEAESSEEFKDEVSDPLSNSGALRKKMFNRASSSSEG